MFLVVSFLQEPEATPVIPTIVVRRLCWAPFATAGAVEAGFSINVLTMFGMVLVDRYRSMMRIVVVGRFERTMSEEGPPPPATRKAMGQIRRHHGRWS
jgi:multidrug efflux pump